MRDSNGSSISSAAPDWRATAFVGVITGMLLAMIFGIGLTKADYDSQEYWVLFERNCAPEVCASAVVEPHRGTLRLMAQDINAVDNSARVRLMAALRCVQDIQQREHLITKGGLDDSRHFAQKLTRENSDACKVADAR